MLSPTLSGKIIHFWYKRCKDSLSICAVCIFVYCIFGVCICRSLCFCLSIYITCTFMYSCYITAPVHCNSGLWSINSLFLTVAISIKLQAPFNRQLTDDQRRVCTALITPHCFTECSLLFTDEMEVKKKTRCEEVWGKWGRRKKRLRRHSWISADSQRRNLDPGNCHIHTNFRKLYSCSELRLVAE